MKCPSCAGELQASSYEGVRVGLCPGCGGVLLTEKGLAFIETTVDAQVSSEALLALDRRREVGRVCPKCAEGMRKAPYGKVGSITVDRCERCALVWLDRGELEAIQSVHEAFTPQPPAPNFEAGPEARAEARPEAGPEARPVESPPASLRASSGARADLVCPKCGHPQPHAEVCAACGAVIAKVLARQAAEAAAGDVVAHAQEALGKILDQATGFDVRQSSSALEMWTGWEVRNSYGVSVRGTPYQWHAGEIPRGILGALLRNSAASPFQPFTVRVLDHQHQHVADVERPAGLFLQRVEVSDAQGQALGGVQRRLLALHNDYRVLTPGGRELYSAVGRRILPRTFRVRRGDKEVGRIHKHWGGIGRELMTDADRFSLEFPRTLDRRDKLLLLATLFFIDFAHFERRAS